MAGRGGGLAEEVGGIEGEEFGKGHARGADDQRGGTEWQYCVKPEQDVSSFCQLLHFR